MPTRANTLHRGMDKVERAPPGAMPAEMNDSEDDPPPGGSNLARLGAELDVVRRRWSA